MLDSHNHSKLPPIGDHSPSEHAKPELPHAPETPAHPPAHPHPEHHAAPAPHHAPEPVPGELEGLIASKKEEQQKAQEPHMAASIGRGLVGGVKGAALGFATVVGAAITGLMGQFHKNWEKLETISTSKLSPAEEHKQVEKLAENMVNDIQHSSALSSRIMRNSRGVMLAATGGFAAYEAYKYGKKRQEAREKIDGEVDALESVKGKWQAREHKREAETEHAHGGHVK